MSSAAAMNDAASASGGVKRKWESGVGTPLPHVAQGKAYMDWNATSPIFPEVADAVAPFFATEFGNPSSDHCFGAPSRAAVATARAQVAELMGCEVGEVVFCGCGSEADTMAIRSGVALGRKSLAAGSTPHVIASAIEHVAVSVCLDAMQAAGELEVTYVSVDGEGRVDPAAVAAAVKATTVLVSVMHSNNEVGTIQDIKAIAGAARAARRALGGPGAEALLVHTDAAQSVGKVPMKPKEMDADLATIVGHKFGAPKGIAALYVRKGVALPSLLLGGGQESGRRAGTEAVPMIVALGTAAGVVCRELPAIAAHMRACCDELHAALAAGFGADRLRVNGPALSEGDDRRLPNTLSVGIRGAAAGAVLADLSAANVAASASAACHASEAAHSQVSFVLRAMQVPHEFALGTLRLSVGRHTTSEEIKHAASAIVASVLHTKGKKA
mmetsp:Transcript_27138/g.90199  ORF Transcript_27138/g.90199 Transcript_27138/m.90199 type:complete len:442 (+) Transcript_27138:56-1381(+)